MNEIALNYRWTHLSIQITLSHCQMNACRAHYYRMTALKKVIIRARYVTG